MRENETRIGGLQWGLFSIFEPAEPRPGRLIDQSIVAWRLASRATGTAAFENPRSVIQRTVCMVTGGSNAHNVPYPTANERVRFNVSPGADLPYNREELLRWHYIPDNIPDELDRTIPVIHRRPMMTAGEVRMRMIEESRRPGFRYPTAAEVEEIQRRFHNPELQEAMNREFARRMVHLMTEPPPPGYREGLDAMRDLC